jgi:acetylornithine deacetylase/succinyl-diaminopimelate desuccinylase-like protein
VPEPMAVIDRHYDEAYVRDLLVRLARVPTDVPLGAFEIDPTDPKIRHFVHDVARPEIERLGLGPVMIDELNNLVVRVGSGAASPTLLFMAYTVAQHGNDTAPELEGRLMNARAFGLDEESVFGKGTSQGKGGLAAALGALKILRDADVRLRGSLILALNNEAQSSHRCSRRIIDGHRIRAEHGIVAIGTPTLSIGNRGRVDIVVTIRGQIAHSSQPARGRNAIWGARAALDRIERLHRRLDRTHVRLGREQLEPYRLIMEPIAPHTLPDRAILTLDRRLLPGTTVEEAAAEVRRELADLQPFEVDVAASVFQLPAEVPESAPIVARLSAAHQAVTGRPASVGTVPFSFDAGYACSQGIQTVMFGPTSAARGVVGTETISTEFVPVSVVREFTKIYAHTFMTLLG